MFTPLRQFAQQNHWTFDTVHTSGHSPADSIAAIAAKLDPGLIVMGTHGHSSLGNVVMGSVATGVIARCKTPVLLIP